MEREKKGQKTENGNVSSSELYRIAVCVERGIKWMEPLPAIFLECSHFYTQSYDFYRLTCENHENLVHSVIHKVSTSDNYQNQQWRTTPISFFIVSPDFFKFRVVFVKLNGLLMTDVQYWNTSKAPQKSGTGLNGSLPRVRRSGFQKWKWKRSIFLSHFSHFPILRIILPILAPKTFVLYGSMSWLDKKISEEKPISKCCTWILIRTFVSTRVSSRCKSIVVKAFPFLIECT